MSAVILHLARCPECMEVYRKMFPEVIEIERRAGLLPVDDGIEEAFHLDYDEHLEPYVDGRIAEIDREIVEGHIKSCGHCAAMLRDLQEFRELLEFESSRGDAASGFWDRVTTAVRANFRMLAFAASILLVIAVGIVIYNLISEGEKQQVAENLIPPVVENRAELPPVPSTEIDPTKAENAPPKDKEPEVADLVFPDFLKDLRAVRPGTLRGDAETKDINVTFPNGLAVRNTPTLQWRPVVGAGRYEVAVFDQKDQKIGGNDAVTGTSWRPQNLRRGQIYQWQVTAMSTNETRFIGQGKFYLTSEAEESKIAKAPDPLNRAKVLAEAGLLRDAEAEIRIFLRTKPDSEAAKKYLRQISAAR